MTNKAGMSFTISRYIARLSLVPFGKDRNPKLETRNSRKDEVGSSSRSSWTAQGNKKLKSKAGMCPGINSLKNRTQVPFCARTATRELSPGARNTKIGAAKTEITDHNSPITN